MTAPSPVPVLAQLAALPTLATADLKQLWLRLYERDPPPYNRAYLEKRLAYRIQEIAHGGLSDETRARLDALADGEEHRAAAAARRRRRAEAPLAGTRLVREWQGVEHHVTCLGDGGFEWQGRKYKSLSAVARAITGTQWNGWLFFGLKKNAG
jgi:Protein of unknown function (DUF2924)